MSIWLDQLIYLFIFFGQDWVFIYNKKTGSLIETFKEKKRGSSRLIFYPTRVFIYYCIYFLVEVPNA